MKKVFLSFSIAGLMIFTSCGGGGQEATETQEAQEVASSTDNAVKYTVDAATSEVNWRGFSFYEATKEEGGHHGIVKLKSGEVSVNDGVIESGNFIADQTTFESVDLNEVPDKKAQLDGHLKGEDFLNVEAYPEATFNITGVKALTEGDYNTEISGNLKFKDVEKNITFKANVSVDDSKVTIKSEDFVINRQDFGITYVGGGDSIIKDEVLLGVNITANK